MPVRRSPTFGVHLGLQVRHHLFADGDPVVPPREVHRGHLDDLSTSRPYRLTHEQRHDGCSVALLGDRTETLPVPRREEWRRPDVGERDLKPTDFHGGPVLGFIRHTVRKRTPKKGLSAERCKWPDTPGCGLAGEGH